MIPESKLAEYHIKRFTALKAKRSADETHFQDLCNYFLPRKGYITVVKPNGDKRYEQIWDTTGVRAVDTFATGFYNKMSPADRRWFLLSAPLGVENDELDYQLSQATDLTHQQINISNYYQEVHEDYTDLAVIGTACMGVSPGQQEMLNYQVVPIRDCVFLVNSKGQPDTVYVLHRFTARQAVQEFGKKNLSATLLEKYNGDEASDKDTEFEFLHIIEPNEKYNQFSQARDNWNMPWSSLWVEKEEKKLVLKKGFQSLRYIVHRFSKVSDSILGESPAMTCLPEAKMLNEIRKLTIVNAEHIIGPQTLAAIGSLPEQPVMVPNGIIWWDPSSSLGNKPERWTAGGDIRIGREMIDECRKQVTQALYNDLFLILQDDKARTASEVLVMAQARLNLLAPNFGRMKSEFYDKIVEVSVEILASKGAFRNLAPSIPYRIEYISTLALAMKYAELQSLGNAMAYKSSLAAIDPSVWDRWSLDDISKFIDESCGVPARLCRPQSAIDEIRKKRAEAMQAQAAMQVASQAAEAVPKLSKAVEKESPLAKIAEAAA